MNLSDFAAVHFEGMVGLDETWSRLNPPLVKLRQAKDDGLLATSTVVCRLLQIAVFNKYVYFKGW